MVNEDLGIGEISMEGLFGRALWISDPWYITEVVFSEKENRLDIYIDFGRWSVFSYEGEWAYKAYDTKQKTWRHLNFFQHECYLHARVPRIDVDGSKRLVTVPWWGVSLWFTLLMESYIFTLSQNMPVSVVARMIWEKNDDRLWSILYKYVNLAREGEDYSEVKVIWEDETSQKRGHNYISLFVDLEKKKLLYVTEGKGNVTVKNFVKDLEHHWGKKENITQASIDMSPAFIKWVTENLPNAEIVFDRFHITKIINQAVDKTRKQEVIENPILKKARYALLKNEENLTEKQKEKLQEIYTYCKLEKIGLKTLKAKAIRESFQNIYKAQTEKEFAFLLKKWYFWATHSKIKPIIQAAKTIKKHWNGILSWIKYKINNGILEWLNSVIQAAKRKARGYRTFKNFQTIAYLTIGKLKFKNILKSKLPTQI